MSHINEELRRFAAYVLHYSSHGLDFRCARCVAEYEKKPLPNDGHRCVYHAALEMFTADELQQLISDCPDCEGSGSIMNCGSDPTKSYSHCFPCHTCGPLYSEMKRLPGLPVHSGPQRGTGQ